MKIVIQDTFAEITNERKKKKDLILYTEKTYHKPRKTGPEPLAWRYILLKLVYFKAKNLFLIVVAPIGGFIEKWTFTQHLGKNNFGISNQSIAMVE